MSLLEKQQAFAVEIAKLILWIHARGWAVTLADGSVDQRRKFVAENGVPFEGLDAQHMRKSLHYQRLAQDLNLFIDGEWVKDSGHPVWTEIGVQWEGQNPLARWGGRFSHPDANHFSFEHEGRA